MHSFSEITREHTPRVGIRWHQFADLFPWIEGKALVELEADIDANGVLEPIVFLDGAILDGRNRYITARKLGVEYPRVEYTGDDPLAFVLSKNLSRRHLTDQQRAMVAAKIAKLPKGRPGLNRPDGAITTGEAAKMMDVPVRSVTRAKVVEREGSTELKNAVETGQISVASGAELARLPHDKQVEIIRQADPKAFQQAAKQVRAERRAESGGRRENDLYPTPDSIIAEIVRRWKPRARRIWEPCYGDGRVAKALIQAGYGVAWGDITTGQDFFSYAAPFEPALCTNPPFDRVREFIDHAFAIGVQEMCLVLPERIWACGAGREQFERHRPAVWSNMDWREDYLGKGGSPDRALAVAIWDSPCAPTCSFDVWTRQATSEAEAFDPETGEILEAGEAA